MVTPVLKQVDKRISRQPLRTLVTILFLALATSLIWLSRNAPKFKSGETPHWWPVILNVAYGRGYVACFPENFPFCSSGNQVTAQREPVPVLLFAAVARLTQESFWTITAVEIIINLMIVVGVYLLTRQLSDERVGLLAALFWAVYLPAIRLVSQVSGDLLATLGMVWGIYFFLRARQTTSAWDRVAAGIIIGMATLSRSVIIAVAGALIVSLISWKQLIRYRSATAIAESLLPLALFAGSFTLTLLPWVVRNYVMFGEPLITTLSGYNLYRHNYILLTDNYLRYVNGDEALVAIKTLVARHPDLQGDENEAQMDALYRSEAIRIILSEPVRYATLSAYRFFALWFDVGVSQAYGAPPTILDKPIIAQQVIFLTLALLGLWQSWPRTWPLVTSIAVVTLMYIAVNSRLRYAIIAMPLVVVLAAIGALWLTRIAKKLFSLNDRWQILWN